VGGFIAGRGDGSASGRWQRPTSERGQRWQRPTSERGQTSARGRERDVVGLASARVGR
jgi:hypothetical protein